MADTTVAPATGADPTLSFSGTLGGVVNGVTSEAANDIAMQRQALQALTEAQLIMSLQAAQAELAKTVGNDIRQAARPS